jgi:hypothetical protein
MERVVLEDFYFIPFTGIGYITTGYPPFKLCFPMMLEALPIREKLPEKYILLEPQAKFELSTKYREKYIQTYYYANFLFNKGHENIYEKLRRLYIPEEHLTSLEQYNEVEVPICFISQLEGEERSGVEVYHLIHTINHNHFAFLGDEEEKLFVLPKNYGEEELLDIVRKAVRIEVAKKFRKKKLLDKSWLKSEYYKTIKILYLNEELQKVFDNELNKVKEMFGLN